MESVTPLRLQSELENEDLHFCLLCDSTIRGLNNYVTHRKNKKCQSTSSASNSSHIDFFTSLNSNRNERSVFIRDTSETTGGQDDSPLISAPKKEEVPTSELESFFMESIGLEPASKQFTPKDQNWTPGEDFMMSEVLSGPEGFLDPDLLLSFEGSQKQSLNNVSKPSLLSYLKTTESSSEDVSESTVISPPKKYIKCLTCGSKVNRWQYGKHLISHYHHHGSLNKRKANEKLVLKYIEDIVKEAPYKCSPCSFYFNWHTDLVNHWTENHIADLSSGYFWCSLCRYQTKSSSNMKIHLLSFSHLEIDSVINRSVPFSIKHIFPIKCSECSSSFRLRLGLKKHLAEIHNRSMKLPCSTCYSMSPCDCLKNNHQCLRCGKKFKTPQELGHHARKKSCFPSILNGLYSCSICSFSCDSKNILGVHKSIIHSENFSCSICFKTFSRRNLAAHFLTHSDKKYKCLSCYRLFESPESLNDHRIKKHLESQIYSCDICQYSSDKKTLLDLHVRRNHSEKADSIIELKFFCNICKMSFLDRTKLKSHELVHKSDKPFDCDKCFQTFKRSHELRRHFKMKHSGVSLPEYDCSVCSRTFASKQHLDRHVEAVHSDKTLQKCRLCSFSCSSLDNLRKHILKTNKHKNSEFVYNCDYCKEFSSNSSLNYGKHLHVVHRLTNYKIIVKEYFLNYS